MPETPPRMAQGELFEKEGEPGTLADRRDLRRVPVSCARISPSPASKRALMASAAAYGLSTPVLLAKYDPDSQSWRTSQRCFITGLAEFLETWPRSGMMRNGTAYQLPPLVRLTGGTGFGLLPTHSIPTPTASDHIERTPTCQDKAAKFNPETGKAVSLDRFVRPYPTPRANDAEKQGNIANDPRNGLPAAVKYWPTPTAINGTGGAALCKWGGAGSRKKLASMVTPQELNGSLNPTWVEWLMGFPAEWTALEPSEMPSSPKSSK